MDAASCLLDHRPCRREVPIPRCRHLEAGAFEHGWHVREVVRLAVHGNLQERPLSEPVAEAAAPAVAEHEPLDEVRRVVRVARVRQELVERLHEPGAEMLPDEDGA